MTYLGYENLQTGKFSLVQTNINIKEFYSFIENEIQDYQLSVMVGDLIELMEHPNKKMDKDIILFMLGTMLKSYAHSGVEVTDEDFFWLRTNGDRFHTIGRKLWKGAKREEVERFFKKQLNKDYDSVYQEW